MLRTLRSLRALHLASALAVVGVPSLIACTSASTSERAGASSDFALSLGSGTLAMAVGETVMLHAAPTCSDGKAFGGLYTLSWASSNASAVAVAADGTLSAKATGSANVTATATRIDDGAVATAAVAVTVGGGSPPPPPPPPPSGGGGGDAGPPPPPPPPPPGVAYTGVTDAMWGEIATQAAAFGDANDCRGRIAALPTGGGVTLHPGDDIEAALATNDVAFLSAGTYVLSGTLHIDTGKKVIGLPGQTVTLDASAADEAVHIRNSAVLANVLLRDAGNLGILFYDTHTSSGTVGALLYQVSVGRTGLPPADNQDGIGIHVTENATGNCIVSTEVFDSYNEIGYNDVTANGGDADGYHNVYGAHDNTFIDGHAYRNGDDGFDMWEGGVAFVYFSTSRDGGKTTGKSVTGDGNGVKLGRGTASHKLYKVDASTNKADGFDLNANTLQPVLVQCTATGNGGQDFGGITP